MKGVSMADIDLVIKIPEEAYKMVQDNWLAVQAEGTIFENAILNGTPIPKGHGALKDEDEIIKAIEDRVNFLKENDALFMRLRKDIDILGCIPKIRIEVQTIIKADKEQTLPDVDTEKFEHDERYQNMVRMWGKKVAIEKYKEFVLGQ